jgi:hypothetical protein
MSKRGADPEILRRLRVGDVKRHLRYRYGATLPDDDAGREDLFELLLPVSLRPKSPTRIVANLIETWAPWMSHAEASQLIELIERTPREQRNRTAQDLGRRLNVTNGERERLRLWTIAAIDMTEEQMGEQRRAKKRACDRRRRRAAGIKPRAQYLADSLSRKKPWEIEGISRRTWERRRQRYNVASPRQELEPCRKSAPSKLLRA